MKDSRFECLCSCFSHADIFCEVTTNIRKTIEKIAMLKRNYHSSVDLCSIIEKFVASRNGLKMKSDLLEHFWHWTKWELQT